MTGEQHAAIAYFALQDSQAFLRKFLHHLGEMTIDEPFTKQQHESMRLKAEELHNAIGALQREFSKDAPI